MSFSFSIFSYFLFFSFFPTFYAQSIQSDSPIPPLQWINLTPLLHGSNGPPPLKDAAIGYDENSRSIIIFGGESQGGFPQSQTYLLNLDNLTWFSPSPPAGLSRTPSARSAVVAGTDFAASYRHGFVVIGGRDSQGRALSDVWEYDFISQFWSQVAISSTGPSPRWGASGGIDSRIHSTQDPTLPSPNNTLYISGGFDGSQASALSDVWRLNISGTLSSNMPDTSVGSWDHVSITGLPTRVAQGGTVVSTQIIEFSGCDTPPYTGISCPLQDAHVINVGSHSAISPSACPAPRRGPSLVPNMNGLSSSYGSQVFVLFGLFNNSLWNDGGGSDNGEIAILDINAATWTRVLPAGDPSTNKNKPAFPVPREGAAVVAYTKALVGRARDMYSDVIIYGGRDATGKYLSDLWLLRSYNASVTASNPDWAGFGNGQLETGVDASGSGVRMQFLKECASRYGGPQPTSSSSHPEQTGNPAPNSSTIVYDTSTLHRVLAPVSVVIILPTVILLRLTSSCFTDFSLSERQLLWLYSGAILALAGYGLGIAGLAISFTTESSSPPTSNLILQTGHGRAGLAFFVCLYGVTPALLVLRYCVYHSSSGNTASEPEQRQANSIDASEKNSALPGPVTSAPQSIHNTSPPSSPRTRSHSFGPSSMRPKIMEGTMSSDSESVTSAGQHRGFEVLNRPPRNRHPSGSWAHGSVDGPSQPITPRSLADVDWLLRRRSLNAVDELDYVLTQAHNTRLETPATMDPLFAPTLTSYQNHAPIAMPSFFDFIIHTFLHASLLGICTLSLIALWFHAPKATFAIFLAWTVVFYVAVLTLSWFGRPERSVLSVVLHRLRQGPPPAPAESLPHEYQPSTHEGPYVHQPPYRPATREELARLHERPRSITTVDDDDDIDEDTRQRMIEEEMERRDVSIVTVPRRKLWVTNPS